VLLQRLLLQYACRDLLVYNEQDSDDLLVYDEQDVHDEQDGENPPSYTAGMLARTCSRTMSIPTTTWTGVASRSATIWPCRTSRLPRACYLLHGVLIV
jgi:hypothetical protein